MPSASRKPRAYCLPVVRSTVDVETGRNQSTISRLEDVPADVVPID